MPSGGISGTAVAVATVGAVLVYAGFQGISPLAAIREVASGKPTPLVSKPLTLDTTAASSTTSGSAGSGSGPALLAEMERIGTGRTYSQASRTGPNSYDCSGLVWRAGMNLGIWPKGTTAFNTASFITHISEFGLTKVSSPEEGDIVWWLGHMGCATSATTLFSAMSSHTTPNIGTASISAIDGEHGSHRIYRFEGA